MKIDLSSGTPIYRQVVDQIKYRIAVGVLKPEDPLPSVRQLALQIQVNPNTIVKAYSELEHQGLITKRVRQGTFVAGRALGNGRQERERIVRDLIDQALVEGVKLGFSRCELEALFASRVGKLNHQ